MQGLGLRQYPGPSTITRVKGHDPWLIQARGGCGCCTDSQPPRSLAWRWLGRHIAVSRPLCACLPHFLLSFARPLRYKGLTDATTLGLTRARLMVRWRVRDTMCRAPGPGDGQASAVWGWGLPHAPAPVASRCRGAHSPPQRNGRWCGRSGGVTCCPPRRTRSRPER
jgi:hypothetical protein